MSGTPPSIALRRATADDAPDLALFDAQRLGQPVDALAPAIQRALDRGRDAVWLAHVEGRLAGYARVNWTCPATQTARAPNSAGVRSGFHLTGLEVAEPYRRTGVGTALTRARLAWCAEQGATEVFYFTRPTNHASLALHAALGFEPAGEGCYDGERNSTVCRRSLEPAIPLRVFERPGEAALSERAVVELYDSVGWSVYTREPARLLAGIHGSTWLATRWSGDRLVALCRVVTDGVSIAYLQDILVVPELQRHGIGRSLARLVLERFDVVRQLVLLTDDRPAQRAFYTSLGLTDIAGSPLRCFARMPGL